MIFFVSTAYRIEITGLKPSTVHNFTFEGLNRNVDCRQDGKSLGDPLVSGADGRLSFHFHFSAATESEYVRVVFGGRSWMLGGGFFASPERSGGGTGPKKFRVASADGMSSAEIMVPVIAVTLDTRTAAYQYWAQTGTLNLNLGTTVATPETFNVATN
jgi:hypothetical protein